ncbi:YibE/F family protein [Streptomyces ipomoeae]|uniref:YibE/F family protein n=1 Tax=Streptomyces ipomoeae TaxID=103232 RepID=UPI000662A00B|nr:YibE/F family protein [Streptomyces ipomoeae]MDX2695967.1 YibE/F family protein [Streptomyces ipomoeae]MDX2819860.1 YibE/F family protein [Streptomyces ipomoeae]MDX2872264.1 YibE/F family protein [Streptomyces ipomoeae]MDX2932536.1 YibE/F family protein [Streptomyces ipomoeae]TQE28358.1 YibE/F family protein [Streptomyces ipomoeae]
MTTMQQPPPPPPEPPRGPGPGPGHGHSTDGGHGHGPDGGHVHGSRGGHGSGDGHGHGSNSGGGHGHSHSHGPAAPVSQHLRKVIAAVLIPFATAVLVGLVVLWPGGAPPHERTGVGFDRQTQSATVTKVEEVDCSSVNASGVPPTGDTSTAEGSSAQQQANGTCKKATIRVDTGKDKGRTFTEIVQPDQSRQLKQGQEVVVAYEPAAPKDLQYSVTDVNRKFPMALLAGIFALAVVVVGRLRGVMALIALAVSFLVLTFFILPAILQGSNPLVVAVVGASAIMLIALYMCHGLSARTSVAVLGTLISLLLIGVLGSMFIGWAALTGNTDDNTGLIHGLYPDIDMSGLLLAGVIIGSLGVLDDVTVTQTSAVWELHEANPSMGWRGLYRAGIRIGRDHIASVVNTLVLAYAGAALPLLLLFSIAQSSIGTVANSELVAEEIVRTLVGSIGLVASVPVTTALAALVVSADRPGETAATSAPAPARAGRGRRRKR